MKTADNYSSYQLDRLVQEIEGRLNDYEGGISEKDETIKSFAFFVGECAKNAVTNALAEYKSEIISLIDEMIEDKKKYYEKSNYSDRMVCMLCIEDDFCYHEYKILALTELKQKIK